MSSLMKRSFDEADQTRTPPKTRVDVIDFGTSQAARLTFEAGWRWSECVGPVSGTETCQLRHVGVVLRGHLRVEHGAESMELSPGDAYIIEPGHDAVVVGDEEFVGYEFESKSAEAYAVG